MNNSTVSSPHLLASSTSPDSMLIEEERMYNLVMYGLWASLGLCSILANSLVLFSLLRQRELRKKYVLLIALAGGDVLMGFGFVTAGAARLELLVNGVFKQLVSRLECAQRIYTPLFIVGTDVPAFVNLLISLDRLAAIAKPMEYFAAPKAKYALVASVCVYAFCFASMSFVFLAAAFDPQARVANACFTSDADGPFYATYDYCLSIVADCLASVIYVIAVRLMAVQNRRYRGNALALQRLKRQARVTKLMAIVIAMSFLLFVIPNVASLTFGTLGSTTATMYGTPATKLMICINSLANFVIYNVHNEEMRNAFATTLRLSRLSSQVVPTSHALTTVGTDKRGAAAGGSTRRGTMAQAPAAGISAF